MPKAIRRYDEIEKGLSKAQESLANLANDAKYLSTAADAASGELKDNVAKKDIQALKDLADTIVNAIKPGMERVRELEEDIKKQKAEFEALER